VTVPRFTYSRLAYDPWYFGGNFGFYNSWNYGFGYGYGRRIWGYPYSYWYDPFAYMPYAYYDPYVPYSYGGSAYRSRQDRDDARPTGSLRLRANPKHAKVIDGARRHR
jgi:hypothetical protein